MPPRRRSTDAAARMAAVSSTPAADSGSAAAPATAPAVVPAARQINAKPVRTTVVLSPVEYDGLQDFCAQVQRETGRRGVAGSEVMRVLLGLMRGDDALAETLTTRVRDEIASNGGNRRR